MHKTKIVMQNQIAQALGVDQSTIIRDLSGLSMQAAKDSDKIFRHHWLEIQREDAVHNGTMKRIWDLVDDPNLTVSERIGALSLMLKCYHSRKFVIPNLRDEATYQKGLEAVYGDVEDGSQEN